jgi:ubiquinone/menaquinone biosynthesis C-methylase UbiE
MDFKQNDAENLELGTNEAFDAILCRWGLIFLPNLDKALSNIMRLLISRGKLATAVWFEPSKVPLINMPMTTARQQLQDPLVGQGVLVSI